MRYLSVLLFCSILVFSCDSAKEEPPIAPKKMEQLVMDLHMAEVYSSITRDSTHNVTAKNVDSLAVYHKEILAHHNLSIEQFNVVISWYKDHAEELDSVYAHIMPRMSEIEARYTR